ncbi:transcription factor IIIA-like isoform X2 [Tachypleus tridentatus]|uniref:transcription factor IIIA-like isoform X2 n=1 Tax=Tachypleus tridentatus TaxID=6853 RepID=UPI003FD680AE
MANVMCATSKPAPSEKPKKSREKCYVCSFDDCTASFSRPCQLETHLRAHIGECPTCEKAFLKHQHLKIHSYEHTGIKPFHCVHVGCGKTFVLPSKLKSHMKSHKGYTCDAPGCEENFSKWTHFKRHKNLCHPQKHECDVCQRRFFTKSNLRIHAEIHKTDREVFCCPHEGCSLSYFQEKNLRAHIISFHEKKRHACAVEGCERTFISRGGLKKHIKLHEFGRSFPPKNRSKKKKKKKTLASILSGYTVVEKKDE